MLGFLLLSGIFYIVERPLYDLDSVEISGQLKRPMELHLRQSEVMDSWIQLHHLQREALQGEILSSLKKLSASENLKPTHFQDHQSSHE
jgi:hypothetical protein